MGIKNNFNKYLATNFPDIFEEISIIEYRDKKIAIDTLIYINKYKAIFKNTWFNQFTEFVFRFRKNNIHCVFVFDSKSPPEKDEERKKRRNNKLKMKTKIETLTAEINQYEKTEIITDYLKEQSQSIAKKSKNNIILEFLDSENVFCIELIKEYVKKLSSQLYTITIEDLEKCYNFLDAFNVQYIIAPGEAETTCVELCLRNQVDCVLSDDSDLYAYQCPVFLTKFDSSTGICKRIRFEKIIEEIKIKKEEFLDFCILCGTDYNPGISANKSFNLIKKYKSIENIELFEPSYNYKKVRELFSNFSFSHEKMVILNGIPNKQKILDFESKIEIKLNWREIDKIINILLLFCLNFE